MKFRNFCVVLPILIALFVKPVLADEGMTRAQFVAAAIFDLGYGDLAAQVVNFENMPFYDVEHYKGYIIIAYHIGIINGIGDGLFAPDAPITTEQAAIIQSRIETRLAAPLHFVHGFYAFGAFAQRHLIPDMDAVSFGWSALEWDGAGGLRLNTGALGGNPWVIPDGY
ncbi:MAG: S-layer homology domain-containing protein, partial [Clostridiales bacterium]|nr:S-layer homology domain-containing protein [Clostridiales bacterium]